MTMMTSWCPAKCWEDEALRIFQSALSIFVIFCHGEGGVGWISKWKSSTSISTNLRRSGAVWEWRWTHCFPRVMQGWQGRLRVLQWRWTFRMQSMWSHHAWFHVLWCFMSIEAYIDSIQKLYFEPAASMVRADPDCSLGWAGPFWCKTDLAAHDERIKQKDELQHAAALMFAKPPDLIWLDERLSLMSEKQKTSHSVLRSLLSLLHSNRCAC